MRKASRLFEIIQMLRQSNRPLTAAMMAEQLEVSERSIYRDIVALQAMRVPVEGERGFGYIMRNGFDLPPLMFTMEETEAIVLALALLSRTGDEDFVKATKSIGNKIATVLPPPLQQILNQKSLLAWGTELETPAHVHPHIIRQAIREEEKLDIRYRDEKFEETDRCIRPLALIYYTRSVNLVAWCDLRDAIRNFKLERIVTLQRSGMFFRNEGDRLRKIWTESWISGPGNGIRPEIS